MTTYDWHNTYRTAVETFNGSTPGPQLEQELLETFQHSPQTVTAAIQKAAVAFKDGKITSPWGIVRSELNRIAQQPHVTAHDDKSRDKTIARAEAWIRSTGIHVTENEIISHLFAPVEYTAELAFLEQLEHDTRGNIGRPLYDGLLQASIRRTREHGPQPIPTGNGPLTAHDTPALRQRMTDLWRQHRHVGEQIELEAEQRALAWKNQQAAIRAAQRQALVQAEAELNAPEPEYALVGQTPPPDETLYDPDKDETE